MTNLKKTVTGSVSIADYSAMVYRYYFLTSCLPMYYDKIVFLNTFEIISNLKFLAEILNF